MSTTKKPFQGTGMTKYERALRSLGFPNKYFNNILQVNQTWTSLSTTSTVEVSLASKLIRAGTFRADGQMIRAVIHADILSQTGNFKVNFGATAVVNLVGVAANTEFTVFLDIWQSAGPNQQRARNTRMLTGGTGGEAGSNPTENLLNDILLDFRGSVTSGGTLDLWGISLEFIDS
jgi:hypothetical protein